MNQVNAQRPLPANIHLSPSHGLLKIPYCDSANELVIRNYLGPVASENIKLAGGGQRSKHIPRTVQLATFCNLNLRLLGDAALVGFGKAFVEPTSSLIVTLHCPFDLFPPELLFGYPASRKGDIWQLACLLFKVHTGIYPFPTAPSYELLIWWIVRYTGPVPGHWRGRYRWDRFSSPGTMPDGEFEGRFNSFQPTQSLKPVLVREYHLSCAER
ncbi:hypothetical protein N657DRAFT_675910 [Parathielavia appendiculata]|uniref:Protein kinase domain-containing protein n=1 Tax=Parathielavia appendiculata TaxID=2587402 RepID=A0AAN6Z706_9PEZI|nr:hypothetical protein N657DRAFT_675910 [Parathielavia appendiculata]